VLPLFVCDFGAFKSSFGYLPPSHLNIGQWDTSCCSKNIPFLSSFPIPHTELGDWDVNAYVIAVFHHRPTTHCQSRSREWRRRRQIPDSNFLTPESGVTSRILDFFIITRTCGISMGVRMHKYETLFFHCCSTNN
jgi:hypothetical protein